jgi:hypothetical protein
MHKNFLSQHSRNRRHNPKYRQKTEMKLKRRQQATLYKINNGTETNYSNKTKQISLLLGPFLVSYIYICIYIYIFELETSLYESKRTRYIILSVNRHVSLESQFICQVSINFYMNNSDKFTLQKHKSGFR